MKKSSFVGRKPGNFQAPKVLQEVLGSIDLPVPVPLPPISSTVETLANLSCQPSTLARAMPQPSPTVSSSQRSSQRSRRGSKRARDSTSLFADDTSPAEGLATESTSNETLAVPATTAIGPEPSAPFEDPSYEAELEMLRQNPILVMREQEEEMRRSVDIAFTQRSHSGGGGGPGGNPVALTPLPLPEAPNYYGLPPHAQRLFRARGVTTLYEWQQHVLTRADVSAGVNFVYSLPTSGGKTLVAEIILMRSVLKRQKSAMFVLPFVSVAEEKCVGLQPFGELFGFPVEGYYGINGRFPLPKSASIFVCTIEKANSLYNHMCEEGRIDELGCVVVDELHMVGEPKRGATLELFLTKVLAVAGEKTQIVGMSATVPNLPVIAAWLQARCYICDFRPVPLRQFCVCDGLILEDGVTNVRNIAATSDHEALLVLVCEIPDTSTLVFCPTRQSTVDTAKQVVRGLVRLFQWPRRPHADAMLEELRMMGLEDHGLAETVQYGVAFHHAGLLMEEREFVERHYRAKRITILCCTSTLAAGVNLPARRVVFRAPFVGRDFLTKSRYLQMCGRAGRAGLDAYGESYLILQKKDRVKGIELMKQHIEDSKSVLLAPVVSGEERLMARALLECVGVNIFATVGSAVCFTKRLLCYVEATVRAVVDMDSCAVVISALEQNVVDDFVVGFEKEVRASLSMLQQYALVTVAPPPPVGEDGGACAAQAPEKKGEWPPDYQVGPTPFGRSSVRSCFAIDEAVMVRDELAMLQDGGLILSDDLHICYFLTPIREVVDCDWNAYQRLLSRLNDTRQRIAGLLGVNEYFIDQCAMGMINTSALTTPAMATPGAVPPPSSSSSSSLTLFSDPAKRELFTTRRFYVAMMLSDLLNEAPFHVVEAKYKVNRGQLQSLLKSASMFSSSITGFCAAMEWFSLEAVLQSFVKRLGFGVKPDIVPLMEIKGVQAPRARALWNAGFKDAASISSCVPQQLVDKVKAMNPKESKSAMYFTIKSAVAVIREATRLVQAQIKEKRGELIELSMRSTQGGAALAGGGAI